MQTTYFFKKQNSNSPDSILSVTIPEIKRQSGCLVYSDCLFYCSKHLKINLTPNRNKLTWGKGGKKNLSKEQEVNNYQKTNLTGGEK